MSIEILGTGHVIKRSIEDVKRVVFDRKPDVVAVELDIKRFQVMEASGWTLDFPEDDALRGWGGSFPVFIERVLALIQRDLGRKYGVKPGADMAAAILFAKELGCLVSPIDRDIEITMNHLLNVPLKEKIKMLTGKDAGLEVFSSAFCSNLDAILERENIERLMEYLRHALPSTYSSLVDERDQYMAYVLSKLQKEHPNKKIVAIVGAGHVGGISRYLKEIEDGRTIDLKKINYIYPVSLVSGLLFLFIVSLAYVLMKFKFR